jgi:hypothetical protein
VAVGSAHPTWIDTDMLRAPTADLPAFTRMRRLLPWPLRATTTLEACGEAIADGIERRAPRIFVPRSAGVLLWVRSFIQSPLGLRLMRRVAGPVVPEMEAEVKALGRSLSEHAIHDSEWEDTRT